MKLDVYLTASQMPDCQLVHVVLCAAHHYAHYTRTAQGQSVSSLNMHTCRREISVKCCFISVAKMSSMMADRPACPKISSDCDDDEQVHSMKARNAEA